ncbi:MAG: 50S ribosomal protein L4 [Planctomycetota bacterium]|nr:MAG: 50S ribosomal protein L4 [Planctomycetota bacterium]
MLDIKVYNNEGEVAETATIDENLLGGKVRHELLHQACVMYMANRRQGSACTKTRGQVAGSGAKPWRQKGTGRARAGDRKMPHWRGGGVAFGPKPRDYSYSIGKTAKRQAFKSALLSKITDGEVIIIDELKFDEPSTKNFAALLKKLKLSRSVLVGVRNLQGQRAESEEDFRTKHLNVVKSGRNIPGVKILPVDDFNALAVVRAHRVLLTREGFEDLKERLSR